MQNFTDSMTTAEIKSIARTWLTMRTKADGRPRKFEFARPECCPANTMRVEYIIDSPDGSRAPMRKSVVLTEKTARFVCEAAGYNLFTREADALVTAVVVQRKLRRGEGRRRPVVQTLTLLTDDGDLIAEWKLTQASDLPTAAELKAEFAAGPEGFVALGGAK